MADKTVTVRPADGDYTSLQAAITGEVAANDDLTAMEGILHIKIEGDWSGGADSLATLIGFTTSADYYVHIYTDSANRASASGWDAAKYRLEVTDGIGLYINEVNYVRIDGLQIKSTATTSTSYCLNLINIAAGNDIRLSNVRFEGSGGSANMAIRTGDADVIIKIWNSIFNTFSNDVMRINCATAELYNSVVYGGGAAGVEMDGGTWTIKNIASFNNTGSDFQDDTGGSPTLDYNASDDGSGTNPVTPANWANVFENAAGGDFRLKSTDTDLHDSGTDNPGSGLYSNDIEGTARVSLWDIGAFEYVAPAGGIVVLRRRRM